VVANPDVVHVAAATVAVSDIRPNDAKRGDCVVRGLRHLLYPERFYTV